MRRPAAPAAGASSPDVVDLAMTARAVRSRIVELAATTTVHIGPSLSVVDILLAAYATLDIPGGDRVVLSKGHAAAALYFVLQARGLLSEPIERIGRSGDTRAGHPTDRIPSVEVPTGALGHGLAVGAGIALGERLHSRNTRVAVVLGDGELNEGSIWEAAAFASHYQLSNLLVIVDRNRLQQSGDTARVLDMEPVVAKWATFGWQPTTVDGHDLTTLVSHIRRPVANRSSPRVLIARTIKGKGVDFMENDLCWHQARLDARTYRAAMDALATDLADGPNHSK